MPAQGIEELLPAVQQRRVAAGEVVFRAGDPGNAGFQPKKIFGLWSTVVVAGIVAAAIGKAFVSSPESLVAIFCEALADGAVLALVAHAMIPEAIHEGGSLIVLPTVAGFLFALYLSLAAAFA